MHELLEWIRRRRDKLQTVAVLTGAGISAESGIPTFRGRDSLWRGMDPTELFLPETLMERPELAWQLYDELRTRIAAAAPNAGHSALAELGRLRTVLLATQNIDGLHQRAGSQGVSELHGTLWRLRCTTCCYGREDLQAPLPALPPRCPDCAALLRPDIVLYTESLPSHVISAAMRAAETCDLMLVIGTSGVVYPAASLPQIAHQQRATVVEINPQDTPLTGIMDYSVRASAAEALPEIVAAFREE